MDTNVEKVTKDKTEEQLKNAMDEAAMSYYQNGVQAAEVEAVLNRDNARYMDACHNGMPVNDRDTARYGLGKMALEVWHANQNLDEMRAAYETAFNAYYEYIFKRDYVGFPEGTDISKERINRKR